MHIDPSLRYQLFRYTAQQLTLTTQHYRDFCIQTSEMFPDTLIVRWTAIAFATPSPLTQTYRYLCFKLDGTPLHCSIHYSNLIAAQRFLASLQTLYKQTYIHEHLIP